MLEELKKDATVRMQKCVQLFRDHLKKLRTGRAHTSLIEHIKVVKSEAENARVAVRGVRREVMNELKEMLKEKLIAQDDDRRAQDEVQKLTDKHVAEIDQAMAEKEKELMQV